MTSAVKVEVGEVLDIAGPNDKVYFDRDELRADIEETICDKYGSNDDYNKAVECEFQKYEPYWTKCIIVTLGE